MSWEDGLESYGLALYRALPLWRHATLFRRHRAIMVLLPLALIQKIPS